MWQKIKRSIDYINNKIPADPSFGVILGSGLSAFADEFEIQHTVPFKNIPHFPEAGVEGHEGSLLFTQFKGKNLVIMKGRLHYYEGKTMEELTYPVRVMKFLGIHTLLLSNAAGGLNPEFSTGDLMIIRDHINLMPNPLIGEHHEELGPRFPDLSGAYDGDLIRKAEMYASKKGIGIKKGCYIGVTGPTYETPAEYAYLRIIGGDAVGMSTVPEVIVARQMGVRCFGVSVITDMGVPGKIEYLTHKMVQSAAEKAEPDLAYIFKELLSD
jgi:purine-nucleoside phosphorylase